MSEFQFKAKKQNRFVAWFKKQNAVKKAAIILAAITVVIAVIALAVGGYLKSKFDKIDTETFEDGDIIMNEEVEDIGVGYTNFVLFGADSRDNDVTKDLNTDSIIIVSLNNETKEIKLVSVYRDTLLDVKNNNIQKCNSAYRRGGAKQAINMLNTNLDLNIQKYVTVNWSVVSEVIDTLGGVEVDVTKAEMKEMNKFIGETASVAGKKANYIKKAGKQTLDGVQATTYARIRKGVGDDYARTGRQRVLIELVLKKAIKADLGTINELIDTVFPQISTNLTMSEILKYAKSITKYQIGETSGFPFEKWNATLSGRGSCAYTKDLAGEVSKLHEFLFGVMDYEPSKKVKSIGDEIAYVVRNAKGSLQSDEYEEDTDDDATTREDATVDSSSESEVTTEKEGTTTTEQENSSTSAGNGGSDITTEEPTTEKEEPVTPDQPDDGGQGDSDGSGGSQNGSDGNEDDVNSADADVNPAADMDEDVDISEE